MFSITVQLIAMLCHELNRSLCEAQGDFSQVPWGDAPEWQRQSCISGVEFHLANPLARAEDSHNNWLAEKQAAGWIYGETKNADEKTHPCIVAFHELPLAQQAKDHLFRAVVHALAPLAGLWQGGASVSEEHIEGIMARMRLESRKMGDKTCVGHATLANGFEVVDSAACVSPEKYREEIGRDIICERLKDRLWLLEGWRLQTILQGDA